MQRLQVATVDVDQNATMFCSGDLWLPIFCLHLKPNLPFPCQNWPPVATMNKDSSPSSLNKDTPKVGGT